MLRIDLFALCLLVVPCFAQTQNPPAQRISAADAIDRALKNNVLTSGGSPFHAVLEIAAAKGDDPAHKGRIELFWENEHRYRLLLYSPSFGQTLVANDAAVMEEDRGDFYPGWLRGFVTALMDPMPRANDLRGRDDTVEAGPHVEFSCIRRDDRPGGITDQMTFAQICFNGEEPQLEFVLDFTYNMGFSDFTNFLDKKIARTYENGVGSQQQLRGRLTTLEAWKPDESLLTVTKQTPPAGRISTKLVSTATEESMLEIAPKDVEWPAVREGKTDGYMIVNATTDRTGQVREATKHDSANMAVESYGCEVALKYKFKPLVIDGIAQQMEMPLVLHFTTKIANPIPELDDKTSRKMISGCSLPHEINDPASAGQQIVIQIQINEGGNIMTLGGSDRKIPGPILYQQFRDCHFAVYKQNGVPTAYHANLTVTAK
jgi:hypothetical protein